MKYRKRKSNAEHRFFYIVILIVLFCFLVLHGLIDLIGGQKISFLNISDQAEADILRADGTQLHHVKRNDWTVKKGDLMEIHLLLPDTAPYDDTSLTFSTYNSIVRITCEGKTLYSYGQQYADQNKMIGHIQITVPLSDDLFGKDLTIFLRSQERLRSSRSTEFLLMRTKEVSRSPLIGHESDFIIFLFLMIGGLFSFTAELILLIFKRGNMSLLCIGLFCMFVGAWYFGYNQFFYVMFTNERFCAVIEYYALDSAPLPLLYFINDSVHNHREKAVLHVIAFITYTWCLVTLLLNFLPAGINLTDTLPGLQILLAAQLAAELFIIYIDNRSDHYDNTNRILFEGITTGMSFAILQILSIRLIAIPSLPHWLRWIFSLDYAAVGLVLLIATIIMTAAERLILNFRRKTEEMELERLAYVDILTGIANRSSCVDRFKKLETADNYAVGFFDVDQLKHANDTYGHETGDALIKAAAGCIAEAFTGCRGFCGRWGGDEFVACFKDPDELVSFRKRFAKNISRAAVSSDLPVEFSISEGYAYHRRNDPRSPTEIVNEADTAMYQNKQKKKKARTA